MSLGQFALMLLIQSSLTHAIWRQRSPHTIRSTVTEPFRHPDNLSGPLRARNASKGKLNRYGNSKPICPKFLLCSVGNSIVTPCDHKPPKRYCSEGLRMP
ncbi:hypothetical protein AFLA_003666 [Aspergillus flavus NRRL3357]|nr:hypothetical protein AFLA_003666 [Aspergillus flavus NRRL3357]